MSKRKNSDKSSHQPAKKQKLSHSSKTTNETKNDKGSNENSNEGDESLLASSKLMLQDYDISNNKRNSSNCNCHCVQVHCAAPIELGNVSNGVKNRSNENENENEIENRNVFPSCITMVAPRPLPVDDSKKSNTKVKQTKLRRSPRNQYKKLERTIGQRVKIYWPNDMQWYKGKIVKYNKNSKTPSTILYDDGEEECLNLSNETVQYITTQDINGFDDNNDDNDDNDNYSGKHKKKKRKDSDSNNNGNGHENSSSVAIMANGYGNEQHVNGYINGWHNMNGDANNGTENRYISSMSNDLTKNSFSRQVGNIGKVNIRGSVDGLFDHGCLTSLKIGKTNMKGIVFDADFVDYLVQSKQISSNPFENLHSMYQLLYACNFGNDNWMNNTCPHKANQLAMMHQNQIEMNGYNQNGNQSHGDRVQSKMGEHIGTKSKLNNPKNSNNSNHNNNKSSQSSNSTDNNENDDIVNTNNTNSNNSNGNYDNSGTGDDNSSSVPWLFNNSVTRDEITIRGHNKKNRKSNAFELRAIRPINLIRNQNYRLKRKVIVIGAGISGLACARELMTFGFDVTILEARSRVGGRICTDYSLGIDKEHGCDIGGGWIHGIVRNPLTLLVERLGLTLHSTNGGIQMYDNNGNEVDKSVDNKVEKDYNSVLDRISDESDARRRRMNRTREYNNRQNGNNNNSNNSNNNNDGESDSERQDFDVESSESSSLGSPHGGLNTDNIRPKKSLGETLESFLKQQKNIPQNEQNLWSWHFSNLEYSNATDLKNLSLTDWDQDDEFAFSGDHCLIKEGYGRIIEGLAENVNIKLNHVVKKIDYSGENGVTIHCDIKTLDDSSDGDDNSDDDDNDNDNYDKKWKSRRGSEQKGGSKSEKKRRRRKHDNNKDNNNNDNSRSRGRRRTRSSNEFGRCISSSGSSSSSSSSSSSPSTILSQRHKHHQHRYKQLNDIDKIDLISSNDENAIEKRNNNNNDVPIYALIPSCNKLNDADNNEKDKKNNDSNMINDNSDVYHFVELKDVRGRVSYNNNNNGKDNNNNINDKNDNKNENDELKKNESGKKKNKKENMDNNNDIMIDNDANVKSEDNKKNNDKNGIMSRTFDCDCVVVTLPLGVLKSGDVDFIPRLPSSKRKAINDIGFGILNKVFFKFSNVFWDVNDDYIGYASDNHGEFYLFVNLVPVAGCPVLMSLVSGEFAENLEKKTDEEIVQCGYNCLQKIFGKKCKEPIDYLVTRWRCDPYAKGSYSYIAVDCTGDQLDRLAEPIKNRLFFAGEATIRKWPASVHGAYLSGIREARNICSKFYNHNIETKQKLSAIVKKLGLIQSPTDSIYNPIRDTRRFMTVDNSYDGGIDETNENSNKHESNNDKNKSNHNNNNNNKNDEKNKANDSKSTIKNKKNRTKNVARNRGNSDGNNSNSNNNSTNTSTRTRSGNNNSNNNSKKGRLTRRQRNTNNNNNSSSSDDTSDDGKISETEHNLQISNEKRCALCGDDTENEFDALIGPFKPPKHDKNSNETEMVSQSDSDNNDDKHDLSEKFWVHKRCATYSPDVSYDLEKKCWYNVYGCIKRAQHLKCAICNYFGASVHCHNDHCGKAYHVLCALQSDWDFDRFDEGNLFFCPNHRELSLYVMSKPHQKHTIIKKQRMKSKAILRPPRVPVSLKD